MPDSADFFDLVIVTPEETLLEAQAVRLIAPGIGQDIAILPDHTPLYSEITKGKIEVTLKNGQLETFPVESGILRVRQNKATLITGF